MTKYYILSVVFVWVSLAGISQTHQWSPEDIIHTKTVSSPVFSPNGEMIVWSQRKGLIKEDKFVSNLYLTRLNDQKDGKFRTVALTDNTFSDYNPLFSKDGESIYFLSSREKGKKLWKLSIYGGEAQEVMEFKNGINSPEWLGDDELIYRANEGKTFYEIGNEKDNTQIIEDTAHWKPTRLYAFHLKTKKIRRITDNRYRVSEFAVSENGNYLVYTLIRTPDYGVDGNPKPQYFLKNLKTGVEKEIFQGLQEPGNFQFTTSGNGFYYLTTKSSDPEWNGAGIQEMHYYDLSNETSTQVNLEWENGVAYSYSLMGDHILAQMANGPYKKLLYYQKSESSWIQRSIDFPEEKLKEHVSVLAVDKAGKKVVYNYSTASTLPEYYVADWNQSRRAVGFANIQEFIELNPSLKKKEIAKSEVIYWEGANGDQVNGILYYPKNYEAGKKYPLMLSIHGGPTGVDQDAWSERWSTYPQILTQKGAFVLKPNYHGSGNHSLEFIESIKGGNYYHLEQIDLYNGIMHLNEKGLIDMDKLGTMGWSNGAILTTWMTLKYPDMFKVAAPGAGDVNWTSDYGTCQFGVTFDQSYLGGAPWDDTNGKHYNEWYINNSPIFEIEKIKTPTIIFHGSEDRAVPRDQGWEYYRGLQQVGEAPVKFLWFPGQPHGLQKITHQLRKMKEEIAWIDQFLFGKSTDNNEAFKKDSPLAYKMAIHELSSSGGVKGEKKNGALFPAMIELGKDSIAISAFEITIAQVKEAGITIDHPNGNAPAVGLTQDQIIQYFTWLNEEAGGGYRLPNAEEAKWLHKKAISVYKNQNNLNYQSGYELTKDDAIKLRLKLQDLEPYSLIQGVGNFEGIKVGESFLFDLGGNASEWYLDGNEWKIYDFSAFDFVDAWSDNTTGETRFTGFRVVKE